MEDAREDVNLQATMSFEGRMQSLGRMHSIPLYLMAHTHHPYIPAHMGYSAETEYNASIQHDPVLGTCRYVTSTQGMIQTIF